MPEVRACERRLDIPLPHGVRASHVQSLLCLTVLAPCGGQQAPCPTPHPRLGHLCDVSPGPLCHSALFPFFWASSVPFCKMGEAVFHSQGSLRV